jgi:hypothetical protein
MRDEPTDFVCRTHGVYGSEFPYAEACGYCAREAMLVSEERERCITAFLNWCGQHPSPVINMAPHLILKGVTAALQPK